MPLLPRYDGIHLNGDAAGYFQAVSGLFASFSDATSSGSAGSALARCARGCRRRRGCGRWRRRYNERSPLLVPAAAVSLRGGHDSRSLHSCARRRRRRLAARLGARSLSVARARARARRPTGPSRSGSLLGLVANGVTTVSRRRTSASGRAGTARSVSLAPACLRPGRCGSALVAGSRAWENGQWDVDTGLHLYTEPLSTHARVVALATAASGPSRGDGAATASGLAIGFATVVKLTQRPDRARRSCRSSPSLRPPPAALLAAGGLVSLPIVIAWWPKGYVAIYRREDRRPCPRTRSTTSRRTGGPRRSSRRCSSCWFSSCRR